jgi:hypothetical protein
MREKDQPRQIREALSEKQTKKSKKRPRWGVEGGGLAWLKW